MKGSRLIKENGNWKWYGNHRNCNVAIGADCDINTLFENK